MVLLQVAPLGRSGVRVRKNPESGSVQHDVETLQVAEPMEELVRRVAASATFEKSFRLRAFFIYVCQCALENRPEAATEQQIGIHVFGRPPGYTPNEDNIVRSQARLLRLKLEHHFSHEGKEEPVVITIPKGQYLPVFVRREMHPPVSSGAAAAAVPDEVKHAPRRTTLLRIFIGLTVVFGVAAVLLAGVILRSRLAATDTAGAASATERTGVFPAAAKRIPAIPSSGEVRIAAGKDTGYTGVYGHHWEADRYFEGGVAKPGPQDLFPPVADPGLLGSVREAASGDYLMPDAQRQFRYHIPLRPGVYELRLYFADPVRHADPGKRQDAQNTRHFQVNCNGRTLLSGFDATADAVPAAFDVRVFKDIEPASDGKVHLEFLPGPERPFVNAIELTPGTRGKLKPIRITARDSEFVDSDGTRWAADSYFINGRTTAYADSTPARLPALYSHEHFGNFSYAIPVAPGSYTVRLHFAESFFSPLLPGTLCRGEGCRVFDVTCNGVVLLQDFDIFKAAPGAFRPVIRTFTGLHPNGQGKLLLSFLPKTNYAEVRAIEVIDEAK